MRKTTRRTPRLLWWGTLLLGSVVAQQDSSPSARMAGMAGSGLTIAECRERMQNLGTLLGQAGYGAARTHSLTDGTLASRWYNAQTDHTVMAFAGQRAEGNAFNVAGQAGLIPWNEPIATP